MYIQYLFAYLIIIIICSVVKKLIILLKLVYNMFFRFNTQYSFTKIKLFK